MSIEIDKTILQKQLNELVAELDIHKQLIRLFGKRPHAHQKPDMDIEEALDCIRICIKYLFLENEALNRVNKMLREMWENSRDETED